MKDKEKQKDKEEKQEITCSDILCPHHGKLKTRGKKFEGVVKRIIGDRAVIEFERIVFIKKYERYLKKFTRLHCHIPKCIKINVGDLVSIQECRPISKIINFVIIKKIK